MCSKKLIAIFFLYILTLPVTAQYYREVDAFHGPLFKTSLTCTKLVDGKEIPWLEKRCGESGIVDLVKDTGIVPAYRLLSEVKTKDTSGTRIDAKYFARRFDGKIDTSRIVYTLDPSSGKIRKILELRNNGDTLTQISYTYTPEGNVKRFEIQHARISWKRIETHEYFYDSLGRIKSVHAIQSASDPTIRDYSAWETFFFYNGKERSYWTITTHTGDHDWSGSDLTYIFPRDLPFQNADTKKWEGVQCSTFYSYSYVECDRKNRPVKITQYLKEKKDVFVYRLTYE